MCAWLFSAKTKLISAYLFAEYEILQRLRFLFVKSEMKNDSAERKQAVNALNGPLNENVWPQSMWLLFSPPGPSTTQEDKDAMPNYAHTAPQIASCLAQVPLSHFPSHSSLSRAPPLPTGRSTRVSVEGPWPQTIADFLGGQALLICLPSQAQCKDPSGKSETSYFSIKW